MAGYVAMVNSSDSARQRSGEEENPSGWGWGREVLGRVGGNQHQRPHALQSPVPIQCDGCELLVEPAFLAAEGGVTVR
jgi:hypothetical protein